jgi:hypothetical protein
MLSIFYQDLHHQLSHNHHLIDNQFCRKQSNNCIQKSSISSLESWFIVLGRLTKLFQIRSNDLNEDKLPISLGSALSLRLQAHKSSTSKEHRPDKQGNIQDTLI